MKEVKQMKNNLFTLMVFLLTFQLSIGQHNNSEIPTSINDNGAAPDASAILDLQAPDKGILIPRMDMAVRDMITSPATGLLIYQLDNSPGFYYYTGSSWLAVSDLDADPTNELELPPSPNTGEMNYWDGTAWVSVPIGTDGQNLTLCNGIPTWRDGGMCALEIGDIAEGGIVFYILQAGDVGYDASVQHGLVAAPSDQSSDSKWGCIGTAITGADGTGIGTGAQNTMDIEAGCTTVDTAADLCANLTLNGYTDWFLPSKDELHLMYQNIGQGASAPNTNIGGFAGDWYWSSTEFGDDDAWRQYFLFGLQNELNKDNDFDVRAVRAF